jgi:DNA-binding NarL/FixJ family response regulator
VNSPLKKILIIDDHLLFADGLKLLLSQLGNVEITVLSDVQKVLCDTQKLKTYALIVIDLHMPGMDGFSFLNAVRKQKLDLRVVVISGTENQTEIEEAIALGANGYIPKDSSTEEMMRGIKMVLDGSRYLPEKWEAQINWLEKDNVADQVGPGKIGPRQLEVLGMMRDGLRNKQIGLVLGISESAVKSHVEILFRDLHVENRTSCVLEGIRLGLIDERPQVN